MHKAKEDLSALIEKRMETKKNEAKFLPKL